jgi:hypothetical protein
MDALQKRKNELDKFLKTGIVQQILHRFTTTFADSEIQKRGCLTINSEADCYTDLENVVIGMLPYFLEDDFGDDIFGQKLRSIVKNNGYRGLWIAVYKTEYAHEMQHKNSTTGIDASYARKEVAEHLFNYGIHKAVGENFGAQLFNIIEDGRIEAIIVQKFIGLKMNFMLLNSQIRNSCTITKAPTTPTEEFQTLMGMILSYAKTGYLPKGQQYIKNTRVFDKYKKIEKYIDEGVNGITCADCASACVALVREIGDYIAEMLKGDSNLMMLLEQMFDKNNYNNNEKDYNQKGSSNPLRRIKRQSSGGQGNSSNDGEETDDKSSGSGEEDSDESKNSGKQSKSGGQSRGKDSGNEKSVKGKGSKKEKKTGSQISGSDGSGSDDDGKESGKGSSKSPEDEKDTESGGGSGSEEKNNADSGKSENDGNNDSGDSEGDSENSDSNGNPGSEDADSGESNSEGSNSGSEGKSSGENANNSKGQDGFDKNGQMPEANPTDGKAELPDSYESNNSNQYGGSAEDPEKGWETEDLQALENILQNSLKESEREEVIITKKNAMIKGSVTPDEINEINSYYLDDSYCVDFKEIPMDLQPVDIPYDIRTAGETFRRDIEKILYLKNGNQRGLRRGVLDPTALWKIGVKEATVFQKKGAHSKEFAFYLLQDGSGSMAGTKEYESAKTLAILEEGLKGFSALKITTFSVNGGKVNHHTAKQFTDNRKFNHAYSFLRARRSNGGNKDGYSIRVATKELLKRPEQKKILFVLSDGLPSDYSGGFEYALNDVKNAVEEARSKGIDVIAIMFGDNNFIKETRRYYEFMYKHSIISCVPTEIGRKIIPILKSIVRK